ncbi:MAG: hypothetical protein A2Y12_05145 [Planctomycetes bacterium GWF2_42_9]|nr:MAG: hypothetical protein A2Y12_05145 [Planctomycetes bacterium GWF2_42_9]HAL44692.1 hypothetical protein [Phycisphaerales bacterium]
MKIEDLRLKIGKLKISFVILISSLFKPKLKSKDLKKMDFSTSAQGMGISFTDKVRNVFRHKWIKKQ